MKVTIANRIAADGTPRFAASHLGLFCLPMSHKKDARLIWIKLIHTCIVHYNYTHQLLISYRDENINFEQNG